MNDFSDFIFSFSFQGDRGGPGDLGIKGPDGSKVFLIYESRYLIIGGSS